MKLLVTGAGGMLGQALSACLESRGHEVVSVPKEKLDVTNYNQCLEVVEEEEPDLIIHCGAYTKVDQAESEPGLAYHINGYGTENLAVACNIFETPMLYFSSDYVFDGEQNQPYTPWDATRPISIYGKSKLAGEKRYNVICSAFTSCAQAGCTVPMEKTSSIRSFPCRTIANNCASSQIK